MARRRVRDQRPKEELIITSLVDIALCLVLGFLVSMPAFIESFSAEADPDAEHTTLAPSAPGIYA